MTLNGVMAADTRAISAVAELLVKTNLLLEYNGFLKNIVDLNVNMRHGYTPSVSLKYEASRGAGRPSFSTVHVLPHLLPFLRFSFFRWLYLFSSFVHRFPFYQNSPTPFPGRRS